MRPKAARIGYDPWLHTRDWVKRARQALAERGAELVAVERNPIDKVWADRPEASNAHLIVHPDKYAGKSSAEKRTEIADWLSSAERRRGGAVGARFDRLGVQRARRRRHPHAGRAGLCDRPCRRHRRPVRRRREGRRRRPPAPRQRRPAARAQPTSRRRLPSLAARRSRSIPSGRSSAIFDALDKAGREDPRAARPDGAAQGDQESGRDRRPESRAGARRRGHRPLPQVGRGARRRAARSTS